MKRREKRSLPGAVTGFPLCGRSIAAAFLLVLLAAQSAQARGKPQIVRHEASFLDQVVVIVVEWQSPNPVVRVTAHVGAGKQEVKVDPYDNRRNQDGYWGELTVEVQAGPPSGTDGIPYILQVEDDLRQKSERIRGKARVAATRPPEGGEDSWGRQHLERPGMPAAPPPGAHPPPYGGEQYPPAGAGPTIQLIDVSVYGGQVTFTLQAYDQGGLREITYRIYDMGGALVKEQQIPHQSQKYDGPTEPLSLPPGNYRVSAQAVGSAGTPSPEEVRDFVVEDGGAVAAETPGGETGENAGGVSEIPQGGEEGQPEAEPAEEGSPEEESALPPGDDPDVRSSNNDEIAAPERDEGEVHGTGSGQAANRPGEGDRDGAPPVASPRKEAIVVATATARPMELKNDGHVTGRQARAFGRVAAGDEVAAVLGPMSQPFRVIGVSVLCAGAPPPGALTVKIYEDAPGKNAPGRLLFSANAGARQAGSPQVALDLSGRNVVVPAGKIWVSVQHGRPGMPGVAVDADGLAADRNWLFREGHWQDFGALRIPGDAVIRAAVIPR